MYHKRCHHSLQLPLLGGSFVILGKFPLIQCRAGPTSCLLLNSLCWPWQRARCLLLDFRGHQHGLENVGGWSQGWETGDEGWAELQCVPDSSSVILSWFWIWALGRQAFLSVVLELSTSLWTLAGNWGSLQRNLKMHLQTKDEGSEEPGKQPRWTFSKMKRPSEAWTSEYPVNGY